MGWRLLVALAVGCLLMWAVAAAARPYTVDDLLAQAGFGTVAFDPAGRWLVFEQRDPYDQGTRFDIGLNTGLALSRLMVADLAGDGPAGPLLPDRAAPGVTLAGFSPSGRRLAVYGWQGGAWRLGVVEMASRRVRWFGLAPDLPRQGRALQWLDDDVLLVTVLADGALPWRLAQGRAAADRVPARWAAAAAGGAAVTVVGSGAAAGVRGRPPAKRLVRLETATGRWRVLARGQIADFEVSPYRRRVAVVTAGADLQPRAGGPVQGPAGLATQAMGLSMVDLVDGTRRPACPACDLLGGLLAWSPDGAALLVFARGPDGLWTDGRLMRVEAATGAASPADGQARAAVALRPDRVRAGWLGGAPVLRAAGPGGVAGWVRPADDGASRAGPRAELGEVGLDAAGLGGAGLEAWALGPGGLVLGGPAGVWRVDAAGRARRLAGPGLTRLVPDATPAASGRPGEPAAAAWAGRPGPGGLAVMRVGPEGVRPVAVAPAGGEVAAASRAARAVAVRVRDARGVQSLWLCRVGRAPRRLAVLNRGLAEVDPLAPYPVRQKGPDGRTSTSWLYRPAPGPRPPPLVIRPYPGDVYAAPPRARTPDQAGFMADIRVLVGHGYAVLAPSLPRGPEPDGPMPGIAARLLAVEAAARADPALAGAYDPDRLAIVGYSFGGLATLAAITETHRFRAAVALAGVSDVTAMWAKIQHLTRVAPDEGVLSAWSAGNVEQGQFRLGAPPWAASGLYADNSPLLHADRVTTPLLLITGSEDFPEQSEAMFGALYRQDKDAELAVYWGEGHAVLSPGNVRDMYGRIFAFLDRRLGLSPGSGSGAPRPRPGRGPASGAPRPPSPPPTGSGSAPRPTAGAPG